MKPKRKVGDTYRPIVHILKTKKGTPTVIKVSGEEYILRHKDQYRGGNRNEERFELGKDKRS